MIIDKVYNTKRGIKYGLINRAVSQILSFCVQAVLIRTLGIEYVGLKGLFTSLLSILSLMELGFGSAILFSMYKPISSDDTDTLCALLNYYKKAYRAIGFVVLIIGCVLTPFLKYLIKGDCPENINIYVLFLLYLANTVSSYWCLAYKASIINAYQKTYILSNVSTIMTVASSVLQIVVLFLLKNYYAFLSISIVGGICTNVIVSAYADKMFPKIKCKGELSPEIHHDIRKKVAGIFISRICYTTRYSFDTIFISIFYGLTQTALYTNYFAVITALNGFTGIIINSLLPGIGNNVALYSSKKNYEDMIRFDNLYMIIGGWMTVCLICLYQPFMTLWVGNDYLLPTTVMMLFPAYFYVKKMTEIRGVYASASGLFWEEKNRNILEAITNLILNYLLVRKFGVFGVMFATLITFCTFGYIGSTCVIFKHYFKCSKRNYFKHHLKLLIILIVVAALTIVACRLGNFHSIVMVFIYRVLICFTITPFMYWIIMRNSTEYLNMKSLLLKLIRRW